MLTLNHLRGLGLASARDPGQLWGEWREVHLSLLIAAITGHWCSASSVLPVLTVDGPLSMQEAVPLASCEGVQVPYPQSREGFLNLGTTEA